MTYKIKLTWETEFNNEKAINTFKEQISNIFFQLHRVSIIQELKKENCFKDSTNTINFDIKEKYTLKDMTFEQFKNTCKELEYEKAYSYLFIDNYEIIIYKNYVIMQGSKQILNEPKYHLIIENETFQFDNLNSASLALYLYCKTLGCFE